MRKFLLFVSFIVLSVSVFAQVPTITSFSPASGAVGSSVTITGTGFNSTAANNLVFFDGVKANLSQSSTTQLIAVVPAGTTGNSKIKVVNLQTGLVLSKFEFTTIFHNANFGNSSYATAAFSTPITFSGSSRWETTADNTSIVACADFDSDGYPDYVNISNNSSTIKIHKNNITQSSQSINSSSFSNTPIDLTGSANSISVYTEDLNADGKIDVISLNSSSLNIFINTSSGSNLSFSTNQNIVMSGGTRVRFVDLNQDGLLDIVRHNGTSLSNRLNTSVLGSNTISFGTSTNITVPHSMIDFAIVDINNDNLLDILSISSGNYSISTGSGSGFGSFNSTTGEFRNGIQTGDFDGDGDIDFITKVGSWGNDTKIVSYINNGSGQFTTTSALLSNPSGIFNGFEKANFNGDAFPDFASSNSNSGGQIAIFNNTTSNSSLSFAASTGVGTNSNPMGFVACDVNLDGRPDIISPGYYNSNFYVLQNIIGLPILNSFTPSSGSVGSTVTISGVNFTGTTAVSFNSIPATSFTVVNNTTITAVVPSSATGSIQVTTPGGTATSSSNFTFAPGISVSGTLASFSKCENTISTAQQITVSGSNLTANISIAALTGYEYSTDGNTWASTLSLTQSSGTVSATVYVRMTATSTGSPAGNIVLSSNGATSVNLAVSGTVNGPNNLGGSLSFNGNNQYLTVPSSSNFSPGTGDFTVEWFQYQRSTSNWPRPFSIGSTQLAVSIEGGAMYLWLGGTWIANASLSNYLNTWAHFAIVKSASNIKVYKDGVAIINLANTSNIAFTGAFNIGAKDGSNAGESFNGYITNFRFSNAAMYTSNFTVTTSPLTSSASTKLLLLASNSGSILTDSGPSALTLTNTASTVFNSATPFTSPISGSTLCIGSALQLSHPTSGGTWSIPTTTGVSISNTGALTGTSSTTATSVVVSYDYTINTCSFTDTKTINISQLIAGTASGNQTLCATVAPNAITLAGNTSGSTIQWQSSIDNATFSNISSATAASLSPGVVTSTTYYRAAVTSAACGTLYSNVITKGYNNSLSFDGVDDYVQPGAPLPLAANDNFTYEAWVRPSVVDAMYRGFLGADVVNVGRGPSMWVGPSGSLHTDSYSGTTRYDMLVNNFFTANTWVHVAWVKNGTTYTVYKNGVQVSTRIAPSSLLLPNANFTIGKLDNFFAGTLDEVRIWNTARTAQEITDNLSVSLNGNETGLKAYYTFNQGAPAGNNTAINAVANLTTTPNLNGTLTGFAKTGATSNFVGGFSAAITSQPTAPSAVCLNASSNTISVTAVGGSLTYQWYSNTTNSTSGATAINGATSNSYVIPTNVAGTKYYYVVVTGSCASGVTSNIVSQVVNSSTFTIEPSSAAQNLAIGGTATALTVASPGATAYQWYSSPSNPSLVSGFNGGTGWTSSTGSFQTFALYAGGSPAIHPDGYLRFAFTSPSSIHRDFALDPTATTVSFTTEYASLDNNNDRGKIQLYFYNASNTQIGTVVQSADLTGSSAWQPIALSNTAIPSGATKVRVVFYQIQEYPYWAGNYGIAFRNPSVTTNVALNGAAITGATSATYTPSTTTPSALYYYTVATGGCSTATSAISGLITVSKATPTIASMSAINKTFGDAAFTLTAPTSNATGAFTFASSNTAVATISGTTVTIVGVGVATITATQATDANYNAGSVTAVLTVAKAARTLTVFADINKLTTDAPFTLVAPISSGGTGAITYSSSSAAVATVSGSTVTIVGAGTSTITATQAADANYLAASITATLTVKLGDSDGDGVPDDVEIREGTDPNNPSSVKDSDGDGVPDYVEIGSGTNPNNPADAIDSDGDGLSDYYEARNVAPTNIALSATAINENNVAGASIANLTATDVNIGEAFVYSLVSGTGNTDNASFTINGSSLRAVNTFDFETKTSYSLRLKVTDKGGLSFEKAFVITVADVNEAPTALALSNASVLENAASGTTVGTLAGTDADAGDTHTYTLVTGTGSTDNASFTITGTTLSTAAVFNFEAKNSYAVRVRVTDAGGLTFERAFTISVTDVNEAPTLTAITDRRVYNVSTSQVVNLAGITAGPETAQSTTTTVSTDKPATFSSINVVGTQIQFTLAAGIVTPQDVVVTVRVKDNGGVANGGVDTLVRTFKLGIDPMPIATASPNLITLGATAQLSATGANAINYTWVAVGGSGIVGSGATINVRPKGTTTYAVVVTNSFGYQATIPVLLTVIVDYKLVPNNLVTPNGDGVNDKWVIPNIDMYPDNEVMVYDKAGRAVFSKRGYNNEWDGTVNGKLLKEDAYFYVIKFNKDGALPIRGYVSIVR